MKKEIRLLLSGAFSATLLFLVFFCSCSNFPISIDKLYEPRFIGPVLVVLAISLGFSIYDLVFQLIKSYGYMDRVGGLLIKRRYVYALGGGMVVYVIVLRLLQSKFCV